MTQEAHFETVERLLRDAEFQDVRSLWHSSNYVYLCQMCGPAGEEFTTVYKPLRGESHLWDFPEGDLYKREVAAYELAKLLGWDFIPPTVARDGPQGVGSVQLFITHDPESHFFVQREVPELVPQLKRMAVFDAVANNADRKGGHCLLDASGVVWGIDHGLCFHSQYKLRSVIWDWVDEPVDDGWLSDLAQAADTIEARKAAAAPLLELLSGQEVTAMVRRMRALVKQRTFPRPGPNRHYPWPLV